MVEMLNLSELLERAAEGRQQKALRQPEATALTLRERYIELRADPKPMVGGDLVTYKVSFDPRNREHINQPLLMLDDDPKSYPDSKIMSRLGRADVMLMYLHEDGTGIFMCTDRRLLEPWPRAGGDPILPLSGDGE